MSTFFYPDLSYTVVGCALEVHKTLGYGLPEICYQNALMLELDGRGIQAESEVRFDVSYKGKPVGYFKADIVVERKIILELKVAASIIPKHKGQLLHYLKLGHLKVGYIFNFANLLLEKERLIL